jgi:hypothetical protein
MNFLADSFAAMCGRREDRLLDNTQVRPTTVRNRRIDIISFLRTGCFDNAHAIHRLTKKLDLCSMAFRHIVTRTAL